jgi:hypothetical protein
VRNLKYQGWQSTHNTHGVHIEHYRNKRTAAAGCSTFFTLFTRLRRPAGGLSDFGRLPGWCWPGSRRPSRWVVLLRCRIGRDEFFTSDNDQMVYLSISVWWTFSPRFTFAPRRDFSFDRSRARRLSLCVFMLLERGRDGGCWSWVVFESPCVSVVSGSFLMNKQPFCLPCSLHRQLPALACTKLRSKAQGRSHQCASQLRWETR